MAPSISILHPPPQARPTALALKLNHDVLEKLRKLSESSTKPKLVVKNGQFSIKIDDSLTFPCSSAPESLRFDIYSGSEAQSYNFTGTITDRLNVISDTRQIKEHLKTSASAPKRQPAQNSLSNASEGAAAHSQPLSHSDSSLAYSVEASDSRASATLKFVSLIALGPMKRCTIEERFNPNHVLTKGDMDTLFSAHTQPYHANDSFIEGDVFPLIESGTTDLDPSAAHYILKDKAYKELRPFQWHHYTDYERGLVAENAGNALGRLGYSDTHPLRRIINETSSSRSAAKKSTGLGGGMLTGSSKKPRSSTNTPVSGSPQLAASLSSTQKRPISESPGLDRNVRQKPTDKKNRVGGSPSKDSSSLGYVVSSSNSSSSEDERLAKKAQKNGKRCYSNESNNSLSSVNSAQSNTNTYTSPSSNNEEGHSDYQCSDEDKKHSAMQKIAPSLPSRPSSSISNQEKKQKYYIELAQKFRMRYKEYEQLHRQLSREASKGTAGEKRKKLMKLFELHNSLSEWKKKLWDYHNENNMAEGVMNLSKHRKLHGPKNGAVSEHKAQAGAHVKPLNNALSGVPKASGKARIALNY